MDAATAGGRDAGVTPLGRVIQDIIAAEGPIPVSRFMALALGHPVHGYYMTRDPFGRAGDFTTAPEISQMFGELLGLWAATVWDAMGRPSPFGSSRSGRGAAR
jgi:SAM-dependent MidA family methyltransferase